MAEASTDWLSAAPTATAAVAARAGRPRRPFAAAEGVSGTMTSVSAAAEDDEDDEDDDDISMRVGAAPPKTEAKDGVCGSLTAEVAVRRVTRRPVPV